MTPFGSSDSVTPARASRSGASQNFLQIKIAASSTNDAASLPLPRTRIQRVARSLYQNAVLIALPVLVVLLFASPPRVLIGLFCVPLLFGLRWLALSSPFPVTRANPIVVVFALTLLWGMLRAPVLGETLVTVARLLAGLTALYLVVDYAERPSRLWNVAAALVLAGILIAFAAPLVTEPAQDKFFDVSLLFRADRVRIDTSNPNVVAGAFVLILPLALALLTQQERRFQILGLIALPPILVMLALLQARSAWVAAGSGILLFAGLARRWVLSLVPVVVLALILINMYNDNLSLPKIPLERLQLASALEGRQRIWEFAAKQIVREPLGLGVNSFTRYAENLAGDYLTEPQRDHAHNLFLQVGVELGLLGLGAFAALYAYALYASWRAMRLGIKRYLALGVFVALVVAILNGLFEVNLWDNKGGLLLWVLIGMAVVLGRYGARVRGRRHTNRAHVAG